MGSRVSRSVLDPYFAPLVPRLYGRLRIPRWLPPEGIIGIGHLLAAAGGYGFARCADTWWGGLLASAGVAGNHLADMVDGTHARRTGQCRNGGELLDHFTDPLSFSYWMIGLAVAAGRLDLGLATVVCIYATAVLTNIRAKITGEFTLAAFGPTEFKTLLVMFGLGMAALTGLRPERAAPVSVVVWALWTLAGVGVVQLVFNLVRSVVLVNRRGSEPDTTDWQFRGGAPADRAVGGDD